MKESDTISVLICVHSQDHEHDMLLQRALESLVRQTYPLFSTVIILDECHEDTAEIVRKYKDVLDIRFFERPKKQGLAMAKNFGISKCQTDWIAYLDADDEWMDCKLEVQRNFLLTMSHVDFCFTESWDKLNDVLYPNCFTIGQYSTHAQISAAISRENVVCHGSALIEKSSLEKLGGYRTDRALLGREDWDLWQRAIANGFKFAKIPERLYIYSLGTSVAR